MSLYLWFIYTILPDLSSRPFKRNKERTLYTKMACWLKILSGCQSSLSIHMPSHSHPLSSLSPPLPLLSPAPTPNCELTSLLQPIWLALCCGPDPPPLHLQSLNALSSPNTQSKRGLSAAEKRTKMLELLHETKDFYQLKELEKLAPKAKGIGSCFFLYRRWPNMGVCAPVEALFVDLSAP